MITPARRFTTLNDIHEGEEGVDRYTVFEVVAGDPKDYVAIKRGLTNKEARDFIEQNGVWDL